MTLEEIRVKAPAVFSDGPKPDVSNRYQFIPSYPIVQQLMDLGWDCTDAHQREDDVFAAHRVTFRVPGTGAKHAVGEFVPTAHLINSHDRTRRIEFSAGLHVCVCSNQLHMPVAGMSDAFTRIHLDGAKLPFAELVDRMLNAQNGIVTAVGRMRERILDEPTRIGFARRALCEADGHGSTLFVSERSATQLLHSNRESQAIPSVWNTLNVVQENLIERGRTGRGIHEILRNHKLNVVLWEDAIALTE